MRALVGMVALEGEDVRVLAAVNHVVRIRDDGWPGDRRKLPIGRRDGGCSGQSEAIGTERRAGSVENDGADRGEAVEERGVSHGLPTTRMAYDQDTVQVDLAVKRMRRRSIPGPKLLQVFEMNDGPPIVLAEVGAVEEVHVNRCRDDPMRRQQLAQIQVSWRGVFEWVMIAVRKYGEWERAPAAGYADMSIERHVGVEKRPWCAGPKISERRNVDPAGDVRRIRRIVDRILGQQCRVGERRRAVDDGVELHFTRQSWVFQTSHFCSCHVHSSAIGIRPKIVLIRHSPAGVAAQGGHDGFLYHVVKLEPGDTKVVPSSRRQIRVRPGLSRTRAKRAHVPRAGSLGCWPLNSMPAFSTQAFQEHNDYLLNRWSRQQIFQRTWRPQRVIDSARIAPTLGDADYSFPAANCACRDGRRGRGRAFRASLGLQCRCRCRPCALPGYGAGTAIGHAVRVKRRRPVVEA